MSAAATAAGYLYASGRLRGRNSREQEEHHGQRHNQREGQREGERETKPAQREKLRVAVLPPQEAAADKPRRTPKIEYRRKRVVTPE